MTDITQQQRDEFFQGFVTAMLWSTGGEPDYSEPPAGYDVKTMPARWLYVEPNGSEWGDFDSERAAIMAAWGQVDHEPPTLEDLLSFSLAPVTRQRLRAHCETRLDANAALVRLYADQRDMSTVGDGSTVWECAGHDFWLNSSGHGVGFWDRDLGLLGDMLSEACEPFNHEHEAYVGDDGLVYVTGFEAPNDWRT